MSAQSISPSDLQDHLIKQEIASEQIVDVRTPIERQEVFVAGSRSIPLDSLEQSAEFLPEGKTLYLMCRSGARALKAQEILKAQGHENSVIVSGGMQAWEKGALPVERGKAVMSLERQVRIAAGGFALLGAILGFLVHPAWHYLSGFVGAGLVFAGLTDTCAMGLAIARMPWNKASNSCCC